jgi:FkbH-like protein
VSLLARRMAWQKIERTPDRVIDMRAYLLSTFTINPLGPYVGSALLESGYQPSVDVGPFDQIQQTLLFGTLADSADVVIVWPRLEDVWAGGNWPLVEGDVTSGNEALVEIGELCVRCAAEQGVTVVVVLPAVPDYVPLGVGDAGNRFGVQASASVARDALRTAVSGAPGVLVFDAESVVRELGSRQVLDHRRMAAATIPYTDELFAQVADRIARLVVIARRGAKKVAVVDADNTLWGGVVGEEGAAGVDLGEQGPGMSYRSFQRYLLDLRRAGTILAVASKNNEADALEVFDRREMAIKVGDLAAWRINWEPKSSNLLAMADDLNLGSSSMVFVDDSAMERAEVEANVEGVTVLSMPEDPAGWFDVIVRSGALDRLPPTGSDLGRAESYAQETRRVQARKSTDLGEFLQSLQLQVNVFETTPADLVRLAQLVAKTNQFTLGGYRHTEAEVANMVGRTDVALRLVDAKDNFGDYGVIGALIVSGVGSEDVALDTFVLSCRAMGRGVEDAMLAAATELAPNGLKVSLIETAKNKPMRTWIARYGVEFDVTSNIAPTTWPTHVERTPSPS